MRRLSPTVLAAIALGAIILLLLAAVLLRSQSGEDDRLTDDELTQAQADPQDRCAGQATYDHIKRELFRQAAELRGSDRAAFDRIAGYSAVRMEAPVVRDQNERIGSVTCSGTYTLDLPPGVAAVGGRRSLTAEIVYTIQPAADGTGSVVTITNAEEIVTPLATLARTGAPAGQELDPAANAVVEVPADAGQMPSVEPAPPAPSGPTVVTPPPSSSASPSFNCANARTSGEIAVCNDPGLAALDRRMAAQFASAMADATPDQRALLTRTRDAFLRYRDNCPNSACIAETYRGRMREIADIMRGRWVPRR